MSYKLDPNFGQLRAFFWPAYPHELKKLLPMLLMMFLICFNYSILHNLKDSLVVTGTTAGAEVLPFLKVWGVLPMAFILTFIFTKLSNHFSQERVFYIIITGFLAFYAFFTFVLYPARDILHPGPETLSALEYSLPAGFKGLIAMLSNWTLSSFYVMSELWAVIALGVLYWGFVNEVTKVSEAPRFYGIFGVGSNIATVLAGQAANLFSQTQFNPNLPFGHDAWEQTLIGITLLIITSGLATIIIFWWMNRNVLNHSSFDELHQVRKNSKENKKKLSVAESFSYLSNSKYLVCIAILVLAYNLSINLVEVVWKNQLRTVYTSGTEYNTYLNNLTSSMGVISTLVSLFMPRIIAHFGWTFTAMLTPVILLVTTVGFFSLLLFGNHFESSLAFFGMTPISLALLVGSIQNCLTRAAKYSVFDATKEMAFIPLSHECKLKGKAAIDGVGSRLGKSGGSLIHQGLLMIFLTLSASTPYVAAILLFVISIWIVAVKSLGKQFNALILSQEQEEKERIRVGIDAEAAPDAIEGALSIGEQFHLNEPNPEVAKKDLEESQQPA